MLDARHDVGKKIINKFQTVGELRKTNFNNNNNYYSNNCSLWHN